MPRIGRLVASVVVGLEISLQSGLFVEGLWARSLQRQPSDIQAWSHRDKVVAADRLARCSPHPSDKRRKSCCNLASRCRRQGWARVEAF